MSGWCQQATRCFCLMGCCIQSPSQRELTIKGHLSCHLPQPCFHNHSSMARVPIWKPGDLIVVGYQSNFTDDEPLSWVYFTATLDAAIWGAELAVGNGRGRIYVVEPSGPIMNDPNLTDKVSW